jgi:hypothetical protein
MYGFFNQAFFRLDVKGAVVNLTASAFPAGCRGECERIQMSFTLQIEDSPPQAAGSFNPAGRECHPYRDGNRQKF